jgi:poly(A) polymerase/tRNA nucleotidyltransferase (CCA-adding enzyme)
VAELPVPRDDSDRELILGELPATVRDVLATLTAAGHEVAVVGGALRERLRDRSVTPDDWDVATSADPKAVAAIFPAARWMNRFGTVTVPGIPRVEVTAFRTEGAYRDRRRPEEVRFGATLAEDLARRDFTINAMAWQPLDLDAGRGRLVDPLGGRADLAAGILRAVGDPRARFAEDALRIIRAARFAAGLGLRIEPETAAALRDMAATVDGVSGERVREELVRMLGGHMPPSTALRELEQLGILRVILPEVAALRGVPQAKRIPGDALDHTLRAVDAASAEPPLVRVAALLHDIGKASTLAGGHFIGHELVGADLAVRVLQRLRFPAADIAAAEHAIRHHMFSYEPTWTDAAVRRFLRRVGSERLELLLALRRADNDASGVGDVGAEAERALVDRIRAVGAAHPGIVAGRLAIDGHDLQAALGIGPSPVVGEILAALLERVLDDPALNDRATLLRLAETMTADARSATD